MSPTTEPCALKATVLTQNELWLSPVMLLLLSLLAYLVLVYRASSPLQSLQQCFSVCQQPVTLEPFSIRPGPVESMSWALGSQMACPIGILVTLAVLEESEAACA